MSTFSIAQTVSIRPARIVLVCQKHAQKIKLRKNPKTRLILKHIFSEVLKVSDSYTIFNISLQVFKDVHFME